LEAENPLFSGQNKAELQGACCTHLYPRNQQ
jgi:hypothetical protein